MHPTEPIIGMCGCGTLFCRMCSPSAVFCARCHSDRERLAGAGHLQATVAHSAWPALPGGRYAIATPHAQSHPKHPSHRVLLEALLLAIAAIIVLGAALNWREETFALGSGRSFSYGIDAAREPLQKQMGFLETTLEVRDGTAILSSDSSYSISARVEGIEAYDDSISSVIPYDLLLAWGDMADPDVGSKLDWEQGNRQGSVSGTLGGPRGADVDSDYVIRHVSNNHVIPANDRILAGLRLIKPGDLIKIDGQLVDVRLRTDDSRLLTVQTSKSRVDQGDGACEIIYIERIKINNQVYQ